MFEELKKFFDGAQVVFGDVFFGLFLDGMPASRQILRMVLGA